MTAPVWSTREPPLACAAVVGVGPVAARLAARTARLLRAGTPLWVSAGGWAVVVGGTVSDLPWVEGAVYVGWDCDVLVPTTVTTLPRPGLVREALDAAHDVGRDDLVVLLPGAVLVSPRPVRDADPALLDGFA